MVKFCVEGRSLQNIKGAWLLKFSVDEGEIYLISWL